jgi:hypothetical protein
MVIPSLRFSTSAEHFVTFARRDESKFGETRRRAMMVGDTQRERDPTVSAIQ